MILRILLLLHLIVLQSVKSKKIEKCLTGYMTDVQSWVGDRGELLVNEDNAPYSIDLSSASNPITALSFKLSILSSNQHIKYLSLAKCKLNRVPPVFQESDSSGRYLSTTLEYLTFFGNPFQDISVSGEQYDSTVNATDAQEINFTQFVNGNVDSIWSAGFTEINFPRLKELDLRACSIRVIGPYIFKGMPKLEFLYIGENQIQSVAANAFSGLTNLIHLDFSRNLEVDNDGEQINVLIEAPLAKLTNLKSLDFSFTKLFNKNVQSLSNLINKLIRLSLCETGISKLRPGFFGKSLLQILDVSRNPGILNNNALRGTENTLQILYATDVGLSNFSIFSNFHSLEILKLRGNEITTFGGKVTKTLFNLQVLDVDQNRISTWFEPTFALMPALKVLTLRKNNLNVFSKEMLDDFSNIKYIALSGNYMVCNCYSREFYDLALKNEIIEANTSNAGLRPRIVNDRFDGHAVSQHTGFKYFNKIITERNIVYQNYDLDDYETNKETEINGDFLLLDYNVKDYMCLLVAESKRVPLYEIEHCDHNPRMMDYDKLILRNLNKLFALFVIPIVMLPLLIVFVFRRNLRYCLITIKNSAMLSIINRSEAIDDGTIFHYDVFVSYCNEDRGWVLDHLLPHLEKDCSVTACLHERDFQVGLSILENIVSCMDRSRCIMLIISQQFLLSQWCQFEMHLAQHRLLETRREDLTLVLLEEIPRRLRPNTLHYLMLTKTYIVWPKDEAQRTQFWRRLKKSLVTQKLKQTDNVSLA